VSTLSTVSGGFLNEVITWVRRIIKSPSEQEISSQLIGDYINRFYVYDMPERLQLFEMKRQYTFETQANIFEYQFPYQQYQMVMQPVYCDGIEIGYYQSNDQFYKVFPELVLNETPIQGNGTAGPYTITFSRNPVLRGFTDDLGNLLPYVFISALDANNTQQMIIDDGVGNLILADSLGHPLFNPDGSYIPAGAGTVNYVTGVASNFTFGNLIPAGVNIEAQSSPYSAGTPRICLFFNNILKLYPVPDRAYKIQLDCYITPSQFLDTTSSVPFAYMAEYLARGAAQKILSDTGDYEQFQFYEPLFRQQENFVLRRTSRQRSNQRTPTIFASQTSANPYIYTQY